MSRWCSLLVVGSFALLAAGCGAAHPTDGVQENPEGDGDEELSKGGCGVARWSLKVGTDSQAPSIDIASPTDTSIGFLQAIALRSGSASARVKGPETTAWALRDVTLAGYKVEADSDFHLVLMSGSRTMIAEIPSPSCISGSSPWKAAITAARAEFIAKVGTPSSSLTHSSLTASFAGIGFLDDIHGQTGVAPNGIELHPVVSMCLGAGCALPGVSGGGSSGGGSDAGVHDSGGGGTHDSGTHDSGGGGTDAGPPPPASGALKNVFLIVMENHAWSQIAGNASAPYINGTLLSIGAHAEQYYNPAGIHPSEPNYLWLEAGDNLGVTNDKTPAYNGQTTTDHLTAYLDKAGVSWRSYQESISGTSCPLSTSGLYAPKHNPMVFFSDVTEGFSASSANCIAHVRPFTELAGDLSGGTTARYNFITPNLCDDMHGGTGCTGTDLVGRGDAWLAKVVPQIMASAAYKDGGAIFVTWDESTGGDFPIGMIVLSPNAKAGHASSIPYTHSSTLRTVQEIFGVTPYLRDAASATDLSDLFTHL